MKFLTDLIDVGTLVPDNATNGDIIMAMFPNTTVEYLEYSNYICIANGIGFKINRSWWNALYKKEGE